MFGASYWTMLASLFVDAWTFDTLFKYNMHRPVILINPNSPSILSLCLYTTQKPDHQQDKFILHQMFPRSLGFGLAV